MEDGINQGGDKTEDIRDENVFDRPRIKEKYILKQLEREGFLSNNAYNRNSGVSYFVSLNGSRNQSGHDFPRRPPRFLEKLETEPQQKNKMEEIYEKMVAADNLHREKLIAKGESARKYKDRYTKLIERKERQEYEKRKRIEEKIKRAEKNRINRLNNTSSTTDRVMRVQKRRDIQQQKTLDKFEQKRKRESKTNDNLRQRIEDIEKKISPVELILKSNDHVSHYANSPQEILSP